MNIGVSLVVSLVRHVLIRVLVLDALTPWHMFIMENVCAMQGLWTMARLLLLIVGVQRIVRLKGMGVNVVLDM